MHSPSHSQGHPLRFYSAPATPTGTQTAAALSKRVEVDVSRSEKLEEEEKQGMPAMDVAHSEGIALKLPPYLQKNDTNICRNRKASSSSSMSRDSVLKRSFSFLSFRDKDFEVDPFMAALQNVRDENTNRDERMNHKRSQSFTARKSSSEMEVDSSRQNTLQMRSTSSSTRSKNMKAFLFRSASERRVDDKYKLRPCSAAFRRFLAIWKARFRPANKNQIQLGASSCFICMGFRH